MIVGKREQANLGQLAWLAPTNSSDPHMYIRTYVHLHLGLSPLILALKAPNRLMNDNNGSSATSARKIMWRFG